MGSDDAFQNITFIETIEYKGYEVSVFNDDYGQSYFFQFTDKKGEKHEASCGSYNTAYEQEIHDYIDCVLEDGTLLENIKKRYIRVRKLNNTALKSFYSVFLSKITLAEKSGNYKLPLEDDVIISILKKEVKELKETQQYYKEETPEWREIERKIYEASRYLPEEMTEEEVMNIIKEILSSGESNKGKIIGATVKRVGNNFDKSKIAGLVNKMILGES